jgi:hypothetical protein
MIKEGDAHTAFHHASAMHPYRRNQIKVLEVDGVVLLTSHTAKMQALTAHFAGIMGAQSNTHWNFHLQQLYPALEAKSGAAHRPLHSLRSPQGHQVHEPQHRVGP